MTFPVPLGGAIQVNCTLFFSVASLWVTPVPYMRHINVINYHGPDVFRISYPSADGLHLRVSREGADRAGPDRLSCLYQQPSVLLSATCQDHCEEKARKQLLYTLYHGHIAVSKSRNVHHADPKLKPEAYFMADEHAVSLKLPTSRTTIHK